MTSHRSAPFRLLVLSLLVPPGTALAQVPVDYPLACRGPLSLGIIYQAQGDPEERRRWEYGQNALIEIPIAASRAAAGPHAEGLDPGTCAWIDRPLNAGEPRTLVFALESGYLGALRENSGLAPNPVLPGLFDCLASPTCVVVLPARSDSFSGLGVSSDTGAPRTGSRAVLWAGFFSWRGSPAYLFLVHTDSPARPDLAHIGAVEVMAAPGDNPPP